MNVYVCCFCCVVSAMQVYTDAGGGGVSCIWIGAAQGGSANIKNFGAVLGGGQRRRMLCGVYFALVAEPKLCTVWELRFGGICVGWLLAASCGGGGCCVLACCH